MAKSKASPRSCGSIKMGEGVEYGGEVENPPVTNTRTQFRSLNYPGLTALPQLLKQTAAATPMYPKLAAHDGHCASTEGP
jgi:hypothetical protein